MIGPCEAPVRGSDEPCHLALYHTGSHSAATFDCDGCGKTYRGRPYRESGTNMDPDDLLGFCFLCVKSGERDWYKEIAE